ncbi:hypothetical protein [Acetobacter fabarum]|uniref:Uncharacterized protein n=1 Tax=Acetobacter fabarum TaxID=483199 RepID=A0A269XQX5_9PROT|nr:hypothetical protein [Acetobacter fabarum]PAK74816.1 hypothetical protein B8X00_13975 [Acetobacter fabarum]PEN21247.1 hypothetical protein CRM93_14080 [Acetobacter fabarum]
MEQIPLHLGHLRKPAPTIRRLVNDLPTLVFCFFFVLLAVMSSKNYWFNLTDIFGYCITDWAVSYAGGFIRRGLSGDVILWICAQTGYSFASITVIIAVICNLIFTATVAILVYPLRNNHWAWLLIYGPGSFAVGMSTKSMCGHKDVLLLVLAGLLFLGAIKFADIFRTVWVLACLALTIPLVLSHEGYVIFIPILFVAISSLKLTRPVIGAVLLIMIGLAAAALVSVKFSGTYAQRDAIIDTFFNAMPVQYSIRPFDQYVAFWYLGQSISDTFAFVAPRNAMSLPQLPGALMLSFGQLIIAIKMLHVGKFFSDTKGKICAGLILLSCLLLAALMTFIIDWTRFFVIMNMLITLAVIMRIRLIGEHTLSLLPGAKWSEQNASLRFTIMITLIAAFFLLKPGKVSPDLIHFGWENAFAVLLITLIAHCRPASTRFLKTGEP